MNKLTSTLLRISTASWTTGALLICLTACSKEATDDLSTPLTESEISVRLSDRSSMITLKQVAETFALNGKHTDLQRELLKKELTGKVVEWRIKVYDIALTDGTYKITSQPYPIESADAINLIRTVSFIRPQNSKGAAFIERTVTDDEITVRGLVQEIVLRSVVVLSPAIIVNQH